MTANIAFRAPVIKIILFQNKIFSEWDNKIIENGTRDRQNFKNNKFCFRVCSSAQYRTIYHDNRCLPCHAFCETCDGGTSNDCLTCSSGYA
jgi:hypothetical protein